VTGDFLNTTTPQNSKFMRSIKNWRAKLSPVIGIGIVGVFLYWIWIYREVVISTFQKVGFVQLAILFIILCLSMILSVYTFTILVQDMGYAFGFTDGYHSLNLSQLASMVPGKIWGFAGLAGLLWSKGISTVDSVLIILINTLIMLSACAIVGITGLISILGWGYAIICLLPFLMLLFGRDCLDKIRQKYYPGSSSLPSKWALLKVLFLGVAIWIIASVCFTWLLYASEGAGVIPFWIVAGAYAAGYLGGFIALLAPSGLGVSEGIVTLILAPYIGTEKILSIAISFRIIQTIVIWSNILITIILTSIQVRKGNKD
jgi:uncharacterized membrane protein YbhN (UPF0104 family)